MSLPDPTAARKRTRPGVYLPFVVALILIAGWTAWWIYARGEARSRLEATSERLRRAGYELSWKDIGLGGYPLRMDVTLTEFRLRDPSGWALEAPRLEAETYMHALGQWVIAAPDGLTFVRPVGGPVAVRGKLIHASLGRLSKRPPNFSFEGTGLTFQPAAGAQPFGLTGAERVEFHLRAGPDDEGGLFAKLDGGKARPDGLLGRIAGGKPVSIVWNSTLSKMSAFAGRDWPSAVRAWTAAGGRMNLREAGITAGDASAGASRGALGVGSDGRLTGVLDVTLRQAPRALAAMGDLGVVPPEQAQAAAIVAEARQAGDVAQASLNFQAGRTTLGPVAIGPAPKVYQAGPGS